MLTKLDMAPGLFDVAALRGPNLLWQYYYTTWITDVDTGFKESLIALFFYGGLITFGEREPRLWRGDVPLWRADAIRDFLVSDGGDCFGLEFSLPHRQQLVIGQRYAGEIAFIHAPDAITINDRIVWKKSPGDDSAIARFFWCADAPTAVLRLLVLHPNGTIQFASAEVHASYIRAYDSITPDIGEECFALPNHLARYPQPPLFRQWLTWNTASGRWPRKVPHVPWPTDPIGIIVDINGIGQYAFPEQASRIQHLLRCYRFGDAGIDGIFYWPAIGWPPQQLGFWPHYPVEGDITPREMDNFMAHNRIRHVILEWCQFGEWYGSDGDAFPDPADRYNSRSKFFGAIDNANSIQRRYPGVETYFWVAEFRLPGAVCHQQFRVPASSPKDAELWQADNGFLVPYDLWRKWELLLNGNRDWQERTRDCMVNPARTRFIIQCSSPFTAAAAARGGADVVDTKTIHRQNIQAMVAAARGTAAACGLASQMEIDSYQSNAYNTFSPLEIEQAYRLFFAAGADMIYSQADLFALTDEQEVVPNEVGCGALRAIRWLRQHPIRGRQVVPFVFLQGDAVHLCLAPDSLQTRDGRPQRYQSRPEMEDFDAITAVLPDFGHYWRGDYRRMFTGAPYGPFDIAPAESALQRLASYRVAVMIGWHGMTPEQYAAIVRFVQDGGQFVCAGGHLLRRGEGAWDWQSRECVTDDLASVFGVRRTSRGKLSLAGATVLAIDPAGQPLVTRQNGAYLVWRDNLLEVGQTEERSRILEVLQQLMARERTIRFEPDTSYLEATVMERDGVLWVNVFNHGRLRQPCELGKEAPRYRGMLWVHWPELIAGAGVVGVQLSDTLRRHPIAVQRSGEWIGILLRLDRHAEFIFAASNNAIEDCFQSNMNHEVLP